MNIPWPVSITIGHLVLVQALTSQSRFCRLFIYAPICLFILIRVMAMDAWKGSTPLERLNPMNASLALLVRSLELLLCTEEPQRDLQRDCDGGVPVGSQPWIKRVQWAVALCFSQRGGGWNWRTRGTPTCYNYSSRTTFVMYSVLRWISYYLCLEVLSVVFSHLGSANTVNGPLVLIHAVVIGASFAVLCETGYIFWVGLGIGSAEECPPLYGSLHHSKSLRGFWGKTWHQCFRRPVSVIPGRVLALFGIDNDSTGLSAFLITGIYHAITVYAASNGTLYRKTLAFFMLQPLGFFIEQCLRINTRPAVLGYLWVAIWMTLTCPLYFSEMVDSGFYDHPDGWVTVPVLTRFLE